MGQDVVGQNFVGQVVMGQKVLGQEVGHPLRLVETSTNLVEISTMVADVF